MPEALLDINWDQPVVKPFDDPAWVEECQRAIGMVPRSMRFVAGVPWVRRLSLDGLRVRLHHTSPRLANVAHLITSQENACRYCLGVAHAQMRMLGFSEAFLSQVRRDAQVAGCDDAERAIMKFCRTLARSSPRPARAECEALEALGHPRGRIVEVAGCVALGCFNNRIATFLAVPLELEMEGMVGTRYKRALVRIAGWFGSSMGKIEFLPDRPAPEASGPFGPLVAVVGASGCAWPLHDALEGAFASTILPRRTKAWMVAIVARALGCRLSATMARELLLGEGVAADDIDRVLTTLSAPSLSELESVLLPWARETVHYQTEIMQRRTHELATQVDDAALIEAVGVAALANSCARLGMLAQ